MQKRILIQLVLKEVGLNINLPAFNVDILKYIVIYVTRVLEFGTFLMRELVTNTIIVRC